MIFYALYLLYGDMLYIAQNYPFVLLRVFLVLGDMSLFIADLLIVQMWYFLAHSRFCANVTGREHIF